MHVAPDRQCLTSGDGWMDGGWTDEWLASVTPDWLPRPAQTQSLRVRVLERHRSRRELAAGTEGRRGGGWDWCGRLEGRRQGRARRKAKVGDVDSDSDLRLPPGRWLWMLDRHNCLHLFPLASFLPSGLAAMVTMTSLHEVHLKEESQENGESFSGKKLSVFTEPLQCLLCSTLPPLPPCFFSSA